MFPMLIYSGLVCSIQLFLPLTVDGSTKLYAEIPAFHQVDSIIYKKIPTQWFKIEKSNKNNN